MWYENLAKKKKKKYKRKANELSDDNKSVYIRRALAYKIIRYINLWVIEADEFRKNLRVKNDQSTRIEREIIAIIMKIFQKSIETVPNSWTILSCCFVFCWSQIDDKNDDSRQKLIENYGSTFVRINPDPNSDAGFDLDVEIAEIYNYINESSQINACNKKLCEKEAANLVIDKIIDKPIKSKELKTFNINSLPNYKQ